ncbi:MAG: 50S ribosomal protein L35 [Chitinophagales bacterium]|nr:50S ribosomal protein L35 [Chitinophagales bacterium]MDW8427856.1 50S ribosomal protein L35 [Chitinophagales bacterium]
MPKMKTNSSAKKRFSVTATGKILRKRAFKRHILTKKAHDRKKRLSREVLVTGGDRDRVRKMLLV